MSVQIACIFLGFSLVSAVIGIQSDHFSRDSWSKEGIAPNLVYFVFTIGLSVITLMCHYLARKWSWATELIIPLFCLYIFICLIPQKLESVQESMLFQEKTLEQTQSDLFIFNFACAVLFTSHYSISVAGRSILFANSLETIFRRSVHHDYPLLPMVFNFLFVVGTVEFCTYTISYQRVILFLEKERA